MFAAPGSTSPAPPIQRPPLNWDRVTGAGGPSAAADAGTALVQVLAETAWSLQHQVLDHKRGATL